MFGQRIVKAAVAAGALAVGVNVTAGQQPEAAPRPKAAAADRRIFIDAVCVAVRPGFDVRTGLAADGGAVGGHVWTLTDREARLFRAALRAEPEADYLSRTRLTLSGGQNGFFQIGEQVKTAQPAAQPKGGEGQAQLITYTDVGALLRVTPKLAADGKAVRLAAEVQVSNPSDRLVDLGNGVTASAIDIQTLQAAADVPAGGAVVIGGLVENRNGKPATETVWVLTPTVGAVPTSTVK